MKLEIISNVFLIFFLVDLINGHGMLLTPVNRASRWRYNSSALRNYNDNGLYCGGYNVQHNKNGGKCGLCGDNWADPRPRLHELGGHFGEGVIVKTYKSGSEIETKARLTFNHLGGHFYYKLCNLDNDTEREECFEKYPLETEDGKDFYTLKSKSHKDFLVRVKLPKIRCKHCILQWTYVTANSWGYCSNGVGKLGCGPQEHFRTCSDISVL